MLASVRCWWTRRQPVPGRYWVLLQKDNRKRRSLSRFLYNAAVVQQKERRIVDPKDVGSSPIHGASFPDGDLPLYTSYL